MLPDCFHHAGLLGTIERAVRQADSENLVGAESHAITLIPIEHVEQATAIGFDKACKALFRQRCQRLIRRGIALELARKFGDHAQRVVPQGVDLDRLADARRHHLITDFGIHPRYLQPGCPSTQQAVYRIVRNAQPGARNVRGNNGSETGIGTLERGFVSAGGVISAPRLDIPERGIGAGIDCLASILYKIGQQTITQGMGKSLQNAPCRIQPPACQRQARQGNQRVAPPLAKPRITGNHRFPRNPIQRTRKQETVSRQHQLRHPRRRISID